MKVPVACHRSQMPICEDSFIGWDVTVKAESGQPIMTSVPVVDLLASFASVQG